MPVQRSAVLQMCRACLTATTASSSSLPAQVLDAADAEFPFAGSAPLRAARLGVAHSRAVARRDVHAATRVGAAMCALAPPGDATNLPLRCAGLCGNCPALGWPMLSWARALLEGGYMRPSLSTASGGRGASPCCPGCRVCTQGCYLAYCADAIAAALQGRGGGAQRGGADCHGAPGGRTRRRVRAVLAVRGRGASGALGCLLCRVMGLRAPDSTMPARPRLAHSAALCYPCAMSCSTHASYDCPILSPIMPHATSWLCLAAFALQRAAALAVSQAAGHLHTCWAGMHRMRPCGCWCCWRTRMLRPACPLPRCPTRWLRACTRGIPMLTCWCGPCLA